MYTKTSCPLLKLRDVIVAFLSSLFHFTFGSIQQPVAQLSHACVCGPALSTCLTIPPVWCWTADRFAAPSCSLPRTLRHLLQIPGVVQWQLGSCQIAMTPLLSVLAHFSGQDRSVGQLHGLAATCHFLLTAEFLGWSRFKLASRA